MQPLKDLSALGPAEIQQLFSQYTSIFEGAISSAGAVKEKKQHYFIVACSSVLALGLVSWISAWYFGLGAGLVVAVAAHFLFGDEFEGAARSGAEALVASVTTGCPGYDAIDAPKVVAALKVWLSQYECRPELRSSLDAVIGEFEAQHGQWRDVIDKGVQQLQRLAPPS